MTESYDKWVADNRDKISANSNYMIIEKRKNRYLYIFVSILWIISLLCIVGVFYYVSTNNYLKSALLCGSIYVNNTCEPTYCGSYNISFPPINIPACPNFNISQINVSCGNSS